MFGQNELFTQAKYIAGVFFPLQYKMNECAIEAVQKIFALLFSVIVCQ